MKPTLAKYRHGQSTRALPGSAEGLPADFALQHPDDYADYRQLAEFHSKKP